MIKNNMHIIVTSVSMLVLVSCANPSYEVHHVYNDNKTQSNDTSSADGGGDFSSAGSDATQGAGGPSQARGGAYVNQGQGDAPSSIVESGGSASAHKGHVSEKFVSTPLPTPERDDGEAVSQQDVSPQSASSSTVSDKPADSHVHLAPGQYVVQPGDTLYSIAKRFNVPLRDTIDKNNLQPPYQVKIGEILSLPTVKKHRVRPHETVYGISKQYGVSVSELMDINHIKPPYNIKIGDDLVIPGKVVNVSDNKATLAPSSSTGVAQDEKEKSVTSALAPSSSDQGKTHKGEARKKHVKKEAKEKKETKEKVKHIEKVHPISEKVPPRVSSKFLWPVHGRVISRFGQEDSGISNNGITIAAPAGTPIRAAENGLVVYSGDKIKGFGNLILIKHAGGYITAYAHAQKSIVYRGEQVKRGQVIGTVGNTGSVEKPQLNFQIRKGRQILNPTRYLQ